MSDTPAMISLIIPVYNRAKLVVPTLESIEGQTSRDFELILVDNNSTDGTYEVLESWCRRMQERDIFTRLIRCVVPGAAAARNAGLEINRCDYVMFFDSDDIMPPQHVASVLNAIGRHPEAELIGWDVVLDTAGKRTVKTFARRGDQWHNLMHGGMATQRWCASADLLRRAGGWNPEVRYWDDIELGCRMLAQKPVIFYTGVSDVCVICHPESITGTYTCDPSRMEAALRSMESVLRQNVWTDIKRAVEYGLSARCGNSRDKELMSELLRRNKGLKKQLCRIAYHQTRLGIPGAARLLRPFCRLCLPH